MKVEIWFDFTCPFSYVAIKNFTGALEKFNNKKDVKLFLRSYNVNPYIDKTLNIDVYEYLANHRDISKENALKIVEHVKNKFSGEKFKFDFDNLIPTTSIKAHNILKMLDDTWAKIVFIEYVFLAHFKEGKDISSLKTLLEIGKNVGLKEEDIKAVFETEMYVADINYDSNKLEELGLNGVPAFVIDETYSLMGSHPEEAYLEMLDDYYRKATNNIEKEPEYCRDGVC